MPSNDPDEMAADFTQLVDDLAYAKTFYPPGKVTNYINSQASRIYLDIYKNRKVSTIMKKIDVTIVFDYFLRKD